MAVELRTYLEKQLSHPLPASVIFDFPSIESLAKQILEILYPTSETPEVKEIAIGNKNTISAQEHESNVDNLTDAQISALIDGELSSLTTHKEQK